MSTAAGDSAWALIQPHAPDGDVSEGQPDLDFFVGIRSFGGERTECGLSSKPDVYTSISSFSEWINNTIDVRNMI